MNISKKYFTTKLSRLRSFRKLSNLLSRAKEEYHKKGLGYIIRAGNRKTMNYIIGLVVYPYYSIFKSSRTFLLHGNSYYYFYHRYSLTWQNERIVEVPIVWEIVKEYAGKNILEVGNVLSHYFPVNYDILDKYEKDDGVVNEDIVSFQPSKKYDLIVSISTIEHVGWDEDQRDSTKILRAIENLKKLIAPGGKIVITFPVGYNPEMDKLLNEGKICFTKQYNMQRVSKDNAWIEVSSQHLKNIKYDEPFKYANGLIIGIIEKLA